MEKFTTVTKIAAVVTLLVGTALPAEEIPEYNYPIRSNAMGGASTAATNDDESLWTNPSGISRSRKARSRNKVHLFKIPSLTLGANSLSPNFMQSNTQTQKALVKSAGTVERKPFWATAGASPTIIFDIGSNAPAAIALFSNLMTRAISSEDGSEVETKMIGDTGGVVTLGMTNRSNRAAFALSARYIMRGAFESSVPISTLSDSTMMKTVFSDNTNTTTATALDAGVMLTAADFWLPTLGISVLNLPIGCKKDYINPFSKLRETVCGTVYSGTVKNHDAISLVDPTDLRIGISVTPRITRSVGLKIAADAHQLHVLSGTDHYGLDQVPVEQRFNGGIELFYGSPILPNIASIAAGYSSGYITMGGSFRALGLSMGYAKFSRNVSNSAKKVEDVRHAYTLSFEF